MSVEYLSIFSKMSSVQHLREFISVRLTAAAEEIFTEFIKTIEEELQRRSRQLDHSWNPQLKLHRVEFSQQHVCKEEGGPADQPLSQLDWNPSLDQEQPDPPQIKEEPEEPYSVQEEQQVVLKRETFMDACDDGDRSDVDADSDQLHSRNCSVSEIRDPDENIGPESKSRSDTKTGSVKCHLCGRTFRDRPSLETHHSFHSAVKPYACKTCGKHFSHSSFLNVHMRTHTGEKPFVCRTCGKKFSTNSNLFIHMKIHTGEKAYTCETCGKSFTQIGNLNVHVRSHAGLKPYPCLICGKQFGRGSSLRVHMRTHTGEITYKIFGKL